MTFGFRSVHRTGCALHGMQASSIPIAASPNRWRASSCPLYVAYPPFHAYPPLPFSGRWSIPKALKIDVFEKRQHDRLDFFSVLSHFIRVPLTEPDAVPET